MSRRLGLAGLVLVASCARQAPEAPPVSVGEPARAEAAQRPILAEITNQSPPVGVKVLDARRVAPDTVRLELEVANLASVSASTSELADAQKALGALRDLSLTTADGRRRFFPLHDAAGQMAWSGLEPPGPGDRRQVWVLFPAPASDEGGERLTLVLPGLAPVRDIPVSK